VMSVWKKQNKTTRKGGEMSQETYVNTVHMLGTLMDRITYVLNASHGKGGLKMAVKVQETFAQVTWSTEDILELKPDWTEKQARAFLVHNEKYIIDGMVRCGWEVLEHLL
jgi:hypothetical protein